LWKKIVCVLDSTAIVSDKKIKKEKASPVQAWTGPKDSRRLKFQYFLTIGT
jgi:hypothetical protein